VPSSPIQLYEGPSIISSTLALLSSALSVVESFMREQSRESEDSWVSDMVVAYITPIDKDTWDNGNLLSVRESWVPDSKSSSIIPNGPIFNSYIRVRIVSIDTRV
jgi:hypothetical protein